MSEKTAKIFVLVPSRIENFDGTNIKDNLIYFVQHTGTIWHNGIQYGLGKNNVVESGHNHDNLEILNGITAEMIEKWNAYDDRISQLENADSVNVSDFWSVYNEATE